MISYNCQRRRYLSGLLFRFAFTGLKMKGESLCEKFDRIRMRVMFFADIIDCACDNPAQHCLARPKEWCILASLFFVNSKTAALRLLLLKIIEGGLSLTNGHLLGLLTLSTVLRYSQHSVNCCQQVIRAKCPFVLKETSK